MDICIFKDETTELGHLIRGMGPELIEMIRILKNKSVVNVICCRYYMTRNYAVTNYSIPREIVHLLLHCKLEGSNAFSLAAVSSARSSFPIMPEWRLQPVLV